MEITVFQFISMNIIAFISGVVLGLFIMLAMVYKNWI